MKLQDVQHVQKSFWLVDGIIYKLKNIFWIIYHEYIIFTIDAYIYFNICK